MKYLNQHVIIWIVAAVLVSCQDKQWDEHGKISAEGIDASLPDVIQTYPEASLFFQALITTGYDIFLAEANNFTVFVPENAAWQEIDFTDVEALKKIVANHIVYGKKLSSEPSLYEPLQGINNKVLRYDHKTQSFNGVQIISADHLANNGVFHITNRVIALKQNIWEYLSATNYLQTQYIRTLNRVEIDIEKSAQTGVNAVGQIVYDTVWINVNKFLDLAPLDDEHKTFTYIVLEDDGFNQLYHKYHNYFILSDSVATDSLTRFNICQDFVFEGIVDIAQYDTLTNIFGLKVPVKDVAVARTYDASNGKVYVIDQSNILLREKINPIFIEGENYTQASSPSWLFVQYKLWASGTRSIALMSGAQQTNTLHTVDVNGQDSVYTDFVTFRWGDQNSGLNMNNSWVEYKAHAHSANYEIHYLSYDDLNGHVFDDPNRNMRFEQKLFVSLPGQPPLGKGGNSLHPDAIVNNYLGNTQCFVSQDTAGIFKERKMKQWTLTLNAASPQLLDQPVSAQDAEIMTIPQTGELTLRLCHTPRSTTAFFQGWLFLDYIKLVPILPAE
jgi:uncharacterized surface protein with fasciclin (FAS1) repeats